MPHHFPDVGFVVYVVAFFADPQLFARLGVAAWNQSVKPLFIRVDSQYPLWVVWKSIASVHILGEGNLLFAIARGQAGFHIFGVQVKT